MAMVPVRKQHAGDAAGRLEGGQPWSYEWEQDGAVVEVPYEVALDLLAIPHGGFSVAERSAPEEPSASDDGDDETGLGDPGEIEEPNPADSEFSEAPATRKRTAKKTAAKPVEE
jgi:hypothetical protein